MLGEKREQDDGSYLISLIVQSVFSFHRSETTRRHVRFRMLLDVLDAAQHFLDFRQNEQQQNIVYSFQH